MILQKPIDLSNVTLAVLAGGNGSRMGLPKAWLQIQGVPILDWLLKRMRWPGPTMLVSAPAVVHPPGCELFGCEVVDPAEGLGPLRGILTALEHLSTPMAAVITVDMPCVVPSAITWLVESLAAQANRNGVMCRVRAGAVEHIEPFPSAFRVDAAKEIAKRLEAGRRSVHDLCSDGAFAALDAPGDWPAKTWTNLNTQADLAAFEVTGAVPNPEKKE